MFKRLSGLEHSAFRTGGAPHLSKSMLELQALIYEAFEEIKSLELCDLFVQPTLGIVDSSGLMTSALASIDEVPEKPLEFELLLSLLRDAKALQPIVVLGNVGIGKSTLLRYIFECRLKKDPIFPVFVDFKNANDDPEQISAFVTRELDSALTDRLLSELDPAVSEKVFAFKFPARTVQLQNLLKYSEADGRKAQWEALERLRSDKDDWNASRTDFLQRKLGIKVCLIFDNVDHHWTPRFIQSVIMEAMAQASRNRCRLVVTLRKYNYGVAYERAAYAAHPLTVVRLTEPGLGPVLERRIEATLRKYDARNFSSFKLSNNIGLSAHDYLQLLKLKLSALLSKPVSRLLVGVSGTNFRKLMVCVRYIMSLKTLSAPEDHLRSPLSEYDALECILRPSGSYYESPEMNMEAVVVNLFEDESPGQPGNNLIRIRVLQAIARHGQQGAPHRTVLADMEGVGYSNERVRGVLDRLHNFGMVEHGNNSDVLWSIDPTPYNHELTFSGRFYLEHLIYEYRYAVAVKEATSFPEEQFHIIIGSSVEVERNLEQRAAEINAFDDYIAGEEQQEESRCTDAALLQTPFYRISPQMRSSHQEAVRRLRGAYYPKRTAENVADFKTSKGD